jgi:mannose/fructose/N-acetylgalactosamine-specific phosphotransferase system component IIC
MIGKPRQGRRGFLLTFHPKNLLFIFMPTELILVICLGGLVALDKTEAFQTMLSQPLLIGPAVGICLSDLQGGLRIGILLQLAYLWVMPIGTANLPDTSVGSVVGCCAFILLGRVCPQRPDAVLLVALLFSVPFCFLSGWSLIKQRQQNSRLLPRADRYAEEANTWGLSRIFLLGLCGSFMRGAVVTALGLVCIPFLLKPLVQLLVRVPDFHVQTTELPVWGLGVGTMIYLFWKKGYLIWGVCGMILGIILLVV